ncbi:hypothetical protein CIB84_003183, partial [Bambusicola thoracicus]
MPTVFSPDPAGKEESFSDSADWECCLLNAQHCWEAQCREELTCLEKTPLLQMPQQERPLMLLWSHVPWHCLFFFVLSPKECDRRRLGGGYNEGNVRFMSASLEAIEDEAWIKGLSCGVSQQLGSSLRLPEKNDFSSQHAAEINFHLVLDMFTIFISKLCNGWNARQSLPWWPWVLVVIKRLKTLLPPQMELDSMRAHATHSTLMFTHSSLALHASKEQLLLHLEGDTVVYSTAVTT